MRGAIYAVESRVDNYVKRLVDSLGSGIDIKLFVDTPPYNLEGNWWNHRRMFKEMLEGAKIDEPILLMCDDVETIPNWREYWERIHKKAKSEIYCLFNRQRHLFKGDNVDKGYVTGCHKRSFYDQAVIYINQQELPSKVDEWFESRGKHIINKCRQKHFDVVIQEYLVDNGIEYTILTPSLFEHIGEKSSLGHKVGKSYQYLGNM